MKKILTFLTAFCLYTLPCWAEEIADYGYDEDIAYRDKYFDWLAKQIPWETSAMTSMGDDITEIIQTIANAAITAFGALQGFAFVTLLALAIVDITVTCLILTGGKLDMPTAIKKTILYSVFIAAVRNWDTVINYLIGYAESVITTYSGGSSVVPVGMTQPQLLLRYAVNAVNPALNFLASQKGTDYWLHLPSMLSIQILSWGVIAFFIFMAAKIAMAYIQFYVVAAMTLVTFPFGITKWKVIHTAHSGMLTALIQATIELVVMGIMVAVGLTVMESYTIESLFPAGLKELQPGTITTYAELVARLVVISQLIGKIPEAIASQFAGAPESY